MAKDKDIYLTNKKNGKFVKPKIDKSKYLDIWKHILQPNPWCRNLILLTPRGTGKSESSRYPIKAINEISTSDDGIIGNVKQINELGERTSKYIANMIIENRTIRIGGIRNTETAIRAQVVPRFEKLFSNNKNGKVRNDGVYGKNEPVSRISFIGLNTPHNQLDNPAPIRILIYDEIISYTTTITGTNKQDTIPNFCETFSDMFQGLTRPYYNSGNLDDIPYLICLGNPRAANVDLYNLFQIDFDGDKANKNDMGIYNKDFRVIAGGLSKFNIKEMKMTLGYKKNIGQEYPPMSEIDKNTIGFYKVKNQFKAKYGIVGNKKNYVIDFLEYKMKNIKPFTILYFLELESHNDIRLKPGAERYFDCENREQLRFFCLKLDDKQRYNILDDEVFKTIILPYGENSRILTSSVFAEQQIIGDLVPFLFKKYHKI